MRIGLLALGGKSISSSHANMAASHFKEAEVMLLKDIEVAVAATSISIDKEIMDHRPLACTLYACIRAQEQRIIRDDSDNACF